METAEDKVEEPDILAELFGEFPQKHSLSPFVRLKKPKDPASERVTGQQAIEQNRRVFPDLYGEDMEALSADRDDTEII